MLSEEDQPEKVASISAQEMLERRKAEAKAFERKLLTAKELGMLEEKYYTHQL